MKSLFRSLLKRRTLMDIGVEDIAATGVKVVAIDADNTSGVDGKPEPLPGAKAWVDQVKAAGYPVVLLSNAKTARAKLLADQLGTDVIGMAIKPNPIGYFRVCLRYHIRPSQLLMIGDQVITDVLGANLAGAKNFYVFPYAPEERNVRTYAAKRKLEAWLFSAQELLDQKKR